MCNLFSQTDFISPINKEAFSNPDSSYYLGVWWWWLRCPTSKEAITLDLEEIKEKKIQKVHLLDFGTGGGQEKMPEYLNLASPEWNEMVKHAIIECKRLGLEFGVCIATSGCAAPWVLPEDSQQKLVFSETKIEGGRKVRIQLPYSDDVKMNDDNMPVFYRDIVVLAIQEKNIVSEKDVVDISHCMDKDGLLTWKVPKGNWVIQRFGHAPTFRMMNEFKYIDHLRTDIFDAYYDKYIGNLLGNLSPEERLAVKYIISDSWEAGISGWTPSFLSEFQKRRGYDITTYLPVLAGQTMESANVTKRIKDDYRQTVSDLIAEHYRYQQEVTHRNGMYTMCEASGPHQTQADALFCQKFSDVPMGEFWARANTHRTSLEKRFLTKEAVSAGHIYGKNIISAESFTSVGPQWEEDPWHLKPTADRAFCEGINQLFFHTYSHSPSLTAKPGYVYYAGSHINRNVTWWDYSLDWNTYLIRCQYMLQQGIPQADVCFYYGTGIEKRIEYKQDVFLLNPGYQYDYVNSDVILNRMSVKNKRIYLPEGISYDILILPEQQDISIEVLKKIQDMVYAGATVIGPKPIMSIGFHQYPKADYEVQEIADILWGKGISKIVDKKYGKGRVVYGKSINDILTEKKKSPNVEFINNQAGTMYDFIYRKKGETDIYFLANLTDKKDYLNIRFSVSGKVPQLWNPVDGRVTDINTYEDNGECITIPLFIDPFGSMFIVFENREIVPYIVSAKRNGETIFPELPASISDSPFYSVLPDGEYCFHTGGIYNFRFNNGVEKQITVDSAVVWNFQKPWQVSFSKEMGAPESVVFDSLMLWNNSHLKEIKYYSGTASYKNTFGVKKNQKTGKRIVLDLGEMYNVAEVRINGKSLGTCWKKPFIVDITDAAITGENNLEIKVTNLWPNRLIGDQFLPEGLRYTETNIKKYKKDSELLPSGLLGPVKLRFESCASLTLN